MGITDENVAEKYGISPKEEDEFAAQSIAVVKELGLDTDRVNVNGETIALGHPIGQSLLHEVKKRDDRYGLATLCIGGGQGAATIVERKNQMLIIK